MIFFPVMELFYTIQGEGFHQGKAAYFLRIAGCDVGCIWCDVKDSWSSNYPKKSINDILTEITLSSAEIVVITGGEPTLYDLSQLTVALKNNGIHTHLETSASNIITGQWDWICISPKKFKRPLIENMILANELKIIIYNKSDFLWAEQYAAMVSNECQLFLQPEWSVKNIMLPNIITYIKKNPKWYLSIQIHKYIDVP